MKSKLRKESVSQKRTLSQKLHDLRISKNMTIERLHIETGIPAYLIDATETGVGSLNIAIIFQLAKFHRKKVVIDLVDE